MGCDLTVGMELKYTKKDLKNLLFSCFVYKYTNINELQETAEPAVQRGGGGRGVGQSFNVGTKDWNKRILNVLYTANL